MKPFHDCDAVTLARATGGGGALGAASETIVGRFVHAGALEEALANPGIDAFAVIENERTAVDFFADERALGCALPTDTAGPMAGAEAGVGEWPRTAGPRETANERPEPEIRASGRRRRTAPEGRAPVHRIEPAAVEPTAARRAPRGPVLRSLLAPTTMPMSTIGCILLLTSASLIAYLAWPQVPRRWASRGVMPPTTTPRPVAPETPPSCAPIPIIAAPREASAVPAPPIAPALPAAAPALPTAPAASFPYDERAAAVAFMVALAAAHPSDEAYREAARILRSTTKDAREARR